MRNLFIKKIKIKNYTSQHQRRRAIPEQPDAVIFGLFFRETSLADLYSIFIDRYFLQRGLLLQQNGLCGQLAS
jgi:hypothetical protein